VTETSVEPGALCGWRVLELSDGVPAAFCSKILADLGADVVVVEPPSGHPLRRAEPRRADGVSARFVYQSTGKRSVVIPDGDEEHLAGLVREADVLVTDMHPARLEGLLAGAPHVIAVGIRSFGATGPYADHPAHHLTVFHAAREGSTLPSGPGWERYPDRAPVQLGSEVAYFDAGWNAAIAVLAACYDRLRSANAERIDVSVQESELTLNRTRLSRCNNDGVVVGREPSRYGITGMLRCLDGWIEVVGMRPEHGTACWRGPRARRSRRSVSPRPRRGRRTRPPSAPCWRRGVPIVRSSR
jgi:crotonobetainyl-CoA:carnitine CoA-transferase CaiB-like acyl-CoA transferase